MTDLNQAVADLAAQLAELGRVMLDHVAQVIRRAADWLAEELYGWLWVYTGSDWAETRWQRYNMRHAGEPASAAARSDAIDAVRYAVENLAASRTTSDLANGGLLNLNDSGLITVGEGRPAGFMHFEPSTIRPGSFRLSLAQAVDDLPNAGPTLHPDDPGSTMTGGMVRALVDQQNEILAGHRPPTVTEFLTRMNDLIEWAPPVIADEPPAGMCRVHWRPSCHTCWSTR